VFAIKETTHTQDFLSDSQNADTRAEKKRLLDLARRAAKEEQVHKKKEAFLEKTCRYNDRSRLLLSISVHKACKDALD
jgi:hypothetical protein